MSGIAKAAEAVMKPVRRKEKLSEAQVKALNQCLANIQTYGKPLYDEVAAQFNMKANGLRTTLWKFRTGRLDLTKAPDGRELSEREQLLTMLQQLRRLETLILRGMDAKLKLCEKKDDPQDYRETGVMEDVNNLASVARLRGTREKSMMELIESIARQRDAERRLNDTEKPADGRIIEAEISIPLSDADKLARSFAHENLSEKQPQEPQP